MNDHVIADLEPGIFDWPEDLYHADPCPQPSLSSTLARKMVNDSPLHAWVSSPRLNPDFEADQKPAFDIGHAVHRLYLGKGADFAVIDAADYRAKEAKAARERAYEDGKTPLLKSQYEDVVGMHEAGGYQLQRHEAGNPFEGNVVELNFAWIEAGVWNRCRIDTIDRTNRIIYDLKTTGETANPASLDRIIANNGYDMQAAHYRDGVQSVLGGDWRFRFVFQEKKYPFTLSVVELHPEWIETAQRKIARARDMWRQCLETMIFPGYPAVVCELAAPPWHDARWYERELREDGVKRFTGKDALRLGMEFQAPTTNEDRG